MLDIFCLKLLLFLFVVLLDCSYSAVDDEINNLQLSLSDVAGAENL